MDQAHKHAEANRKRLKEFGVDEQFYEVGKELSDYFDGSAAEACSYDPMYTGNVKMMPNNQYKYLVGLAAAGGAKGAWAKQQLEGIKEARDQMTDAGKQVLSSIGKRDWRKALMAVGQFAVGMQQLDKYQLTPKPPKPPAALPDGTVIDAYNSRNETTFAYWRKNVMKDPDKVDILRNPDLEYQEWLYATYGKTEWRENVETTGNVVGAFFRGAVESVASGVVDTVKFGYQVVTDPIDTYKEVKGAAVYVINNPNVVWEAGIATYDQFVNGTAEERAEMLGTGVTMFLGGAATKAVGGVSKGAQSLNVMSNTAKQIDTKTKELDQKIKTELEQFRSQLQNMFSETGSLAIAGMRVSIPNIPDVHVPDANSNVHRAQGPNGSGIEGTGNSNSIGKIVKDGNKTKYTNPAGNELTWVDQHPKNISRDIDSFLKSSDVGKATEAKVADFVRKEKEVTGFGQKVLKENGEAAGDLDVVTKDAIIEVKASIKAVKEEQFYKLKNEKHDFFFNPENKKVILYIDKSLTKLRPEHVKTLEDIKKQGVRIVNSLEELKEVLK